jgi:hypothetical protein
MGATIHSRACLHAMTDHGALAVGTTGCYRMDCAFETVECHGLPGLCDLEGLVVVVAANIASRHKQLPVFGANAAREALVPILAASLLNDESRRLLAGKRGIIRDHSAIGI